MVLDPLPAFLPFIFRKWRVLCAWRGLSRDAAKRLIVHFVWWVGSSPQRGPRFEDFWRRLVANHSCRACIIWRQSSDTVKKVLSEWQHGGLPIDLQRVTADLYYVSLLHNHHWPLMRHHRSKKFHANVDRTIFWTGRGFIVSRPNYTSDAPAKSQSWRSRRLLALKLGWLLIHSGLEMLFHHYSRYVSTIEWVDRV